MTPSLTVLRWIWAGHWRAYPGRPAVAVLAIAIGVALGLGIDLVNRSALGEFDAALAVVNGEAQAQVRGATGSFDEAVYERLARDARFEAVSPVVEARVLAEPDMTPLQVVGIDPMRAAAVTPDLLPSADTQDGAGSADADPERQSPTTIFDADAVFLSRAAMSALGTGPGSEIVLRVGLERVRLRVAGTVPGAAAGQRIAVMDLGTAQWRLGWLGRLTRIDLRLAPGVDAGRLGRDDGRTAGADTLPADLPDALRAELRWTTAQDGRQRMSNLSRAYRVNLNVLALVALFTGGFIVHAALALSVLRQQPVIALLGVLGGSRRMLSALVLGQGAVLGAIGAALGVAGGIALAWSMLALVGGDLGGGYFGGARPPLRIEPLPVAGFGLLGALVGVAGSLWPALGIRRLAPAQALKAGSTEAALDGRGRTLTAWVLFALGGLLLLAPAIDGLPLAAYAAIACWLFAGIATVPAITRLGATALNRFGPAPWRRPMAWLALQRLLGAPRSAAAPLSGVVAAFALASAMAIMVHSFRVSVDDWLDTVLPADLYGRSPAAGAFPALTPQRQQQLHTLPGVARAEFMRAVELTLDPARPAVVLLSRPLDPGQAQRRLPITGNVVPTDPDAIPVFVSEAMVDLYGLQVGRRFELPIGGPGGTAVGSASSSPGDSTDGTVLGQGSGRFQVAGLWRDYARQHGTVVVAEHDYRRLTGDDGVNDVALWLTPGQSESAVLDELRARLPALAAMEFRSASELRAISLRIFDRSFALTYVLEAIAIVVGLFGVATTYSGEALSRIREFGMLRHLGLTRGQIGRLFALEASLLITIGCLWGLAIGAAIALVLVHLVNPQSFHWTMDVAWPWPLLALSATLLVALGTLAAVLATRSATGQSPVLAVREDW